MTKNRRKHMNKYCICSVYPNIFIIFHHIQVDFFEIQPPHQASRTTQSLRVLYPWSRPSPTPCVPGGVSTCMRQPWLGNGYLSKWGYQKPMGFHIIHWSILYFGLLTGISISQGNKTVIDSLHPQVYRSRVDGLRFNIVIYRMWLRVTASFVSEVQG